MKEAQRTIQKWIANNCASSEK